MQYSKFLPHWCSLGHGFASGLSMSIIFSFHLFIFNTVQNQKHEVGCSDDKKKKLNSDCIRLYSQTYHTDNGACLVFRQWCRKQSYLMEYDFSFLFSTMFKACLASVYSIYIFCALYCKCRALTVCGRLRSVFIFSSVKLNMLSVKQWRFEELGLIQALDFYYTVLIFDKVNLFLLGAHKWETCKHHV